MKHDTGVMSSLTSLGMGVSFLFSKGCSSLYLGALFVYVYRTGGRISGLWTYYYYIYYFIFFWGLVLWPFSEVVVVVVHLVFVVEDDCAEWLLCFCKFYAEWCDNSNVPGALKGSFCAVRLVMNEFGLIVLDRGLLYCGSEMLKGVV